MTNEFTIQTKRPLLKEERADTIARAMNRIAPKPIMCRKCYSHEVNESGSICKNCRHIEQTRVAYEQETARLHVALIAMIFIGALLIGVAMQLTRRDAVSRAPQTNQSDKQQR